MRANRKGARRGSVTPLTVLTLTLLVGMVAVAVDGGALLEDRRHAQATADAAALAAAADLYAHYPSNAGADPSGTAVKSALTTAAANGFSNDGDSSVVTVNVSPANYQGGPNAGKPLPPGYVEVLVRLNETRKFSNIFGDGSIPVTARAVARGVWDPVPDGITLLTLSGTALTGTATGDVNIIKAGLHINSNSPNAIVLTGGGHVKTPLAKLLAKFGLPPGLVGPGGVGIPSIVNVTPTPDPLRYLPAPNPVTLGLTTQGTNLVISGGTVDLYPGVYVGGLTINGNATVTLHANPDGSPGVYYMQGGGFKVSQQANVSSAAGEAGGVLLYNAWSGPNDVISITGGNLTLSPPGSGPYQGISIFQARGTPGNSGPPITLAHNGTMTLNGTLYAPYAQLRATGHSSADVLGGQYILDSLVVSGSADVTVDRSNAPVSNRRRLGLVE